MKIAFIADIHCHEFKDFSKPVSVIWNGNYFIDCAGADVDGIIMSSRLLDIFKALTTIRDELVNKKVQNLIIAGDIFHQRGSINTVVFNCVKRVFESFISVGIKVFAIPGNHDQVSNQDRPENSLYGLGDTIVVVDTMCNFDVGDVSVVWIPFTKNKQIVLKYLKEVSKQNSDKPRLLVSHLGVVGGAMGKSNYVHAGEYEVKQLKPNYFCAVVLGHYHKPQFLTDNMIYAGAPIQHNFNDEGEERGYWILDIRSNKKVVFNLYSIDSPKFITKEYHKDIQLDSGDYIRMVVDEKNIDKAVNSIEESNHFVKLELTKKVSVERRIDIDVTTSNEVILGRYVENFGEGDKELLLIGKSIYEEANI